MTWPKLSVVMPNYNHAGFLPESLGAIIRQSYRPLEVIVVDDASTDNSVETIEQLAQRNPVVRLVRNERNQGGIAAAAQGVALASGEYVYFAAADDRVLPGLFAKSMNLLSQYPTAGFCSTLSAVMNEKGQYKGLVQSAIISRSECFLPPEEALATLRQRGGWFMGNTAIYRRSALIEAGGFIPELGHYCDGFMDLVLALKYGACFIPEPLAMWRKTKGTYSERMSGDLDATLGIMGTAERLMRSTYRDLFPADYVDDWEKWWLFEMGVNFITSSQAAQIGGLRRLLQSPKVTDKAFFAVLRLSMAVEHLVTKLYLLVRFRRGHLWGVLGRKLRHIADSRIRRMAKEKKPSVQIAIKKA